MLKFALVGCGRIAKRHSELLGFGEIQGAVLAGVCDIIPEKAQAIGERFKVPHFDNMHKMMKELDPDVVVILTESGLHAEHAVELAPYKKDIVVEKPMALTLEDADRMISACEEHGCRLFVVKQNRFNVPVVKLREALEAGRFGKLVIGTVRVRWCRRQDYYDQDAWRGTWALDGGVLTNQASHHIDLLEWMMGEVETVYAKTQTSLVDIETEDTGVVVLKFRSGALGIIEATTAARPKDLEGSISILGERGTVEIGGFAVNEMKVWQFEEPIDDDKRVLSDFSVNPPNVYGFGHKEYYQHVADCIRHNQTQLVGGVQGRQSLEVISAIYESVETGKEVALEGFVPGKSRLGRR